ncbi:MAG: glycosyltransferase family 2 protein [Pseudonocardiaceae bacterium]
MITLLAELARRSNDYIPSIRRFETMTGLGWHDPTPPWHSGAGDRPVSVVIPACEVGYSLATVLDALDAQHHRDRFEVIVVDDASTDDTTGIAAHHPVVTRLVRLPRRRGAGTARNLGTHLASGDTVLYLDADMVLPAHVVTDIAARATDTMAFVGFRHNLPHTLHRGGPGIPAERPNLRADHRVVWRPPAGVPLLYTGITLPEPLDGRPLEHTRDFLDLGYGVRYYDWDLPRMVVTALLAVPRCAVLEVGGFEAQFDRIGWGTEDTYLGACLIGAGLQIVPLRQAVGYHLDPPDAGEQWRRKLASWPATVAHYRALLHQAGPASCSRAFTTAMTGLLDSCEVLR